jgi:hypothetical protein
MDSIVRTNPEHFSTLGRAFPRSNPAQPSLTIFLFMNNNNNIIDRQKEYTRESNTLKTTAILKTNQIFQILSVKIRNIYNKPLYLIVEACLEDHTFLNLKTCG